MRRVLLAEDDIHLRHSIRQLLEEAGYRVLMAANGMEALVELSRTPVDLVVLDLMMPTFSGWELLRELRSRPNGASTPVLVASALDAAPLGFDIQGFIRKPFEAADFLARVEEILSAAPPDRTLGPSED